jgi:predicted DNA-binding protein
MARDITVKVKLTVEEYIAFKHVSEDLGTTQSSLARWLIKKEIERFHDLNIGQGKLFRNDGGPDMAMKRKL